ncbi:MAG: ferredoxin [Elusimicrobia bacterium]|nr:ferredoxin [Elusimicrobiota bacterium]
MKVSVDENLCTGCGLCVDICPEVFEMPEALSIVKTQNISGDLIEKVREAVESCPVEAIIIEE